MAGFFQDFRDHLLIGDIGLGDQNGKSANGFRARLLARIEVGERLRVRVVCGGRSCRGGRQVGLVGGTGNDRCNGVVHPGRRFAAVPAGPQSPHQRTQLERGYDEAAQETEAQSRVRRKELGRERHQRKARDGGIRGREQVTCPESKPVGRYGQQIQRIER